MSTINLHDSSDDIEEEESIDASEDLNKSLQDSSVNCYEQNALQISAETNNNEILPRTITWPELLHEAHKIASAKKKEKAAVPLVYDFKDVWGAQSSYASNKVLLEDNEEAVWCSVDSIDSFGKIFNIIHIVFIFKYRANCSLGKTLYLENVTVYAKEAIEESVECVAEHLQKIVKEDLVDIAEDDIVVIAEDDIVDIAEDEIVDIAEDDKVDVVEDYLIQKPSVKLRLQQIDSYTLHEHQEMLEFKYRKINMVKSPQENSKKIESLLKRAKFIWNKRQDLAPNKWEITVFFITRIILPTTDVLTDVITLVEFALTGHILWAFSSIWILMSPAFFKFVADNYKQVEMALKGRNLGYFKLINVYVAKLYLPILQTIKNLDLWISLMEQKLITPLNAKTEHFYTQNTLASIYEAFAEASPSLILNLSICLWTGRLSNIQTGSIVVSFLSLSNTACNIVFQYRSFDERDPDPSWRMKLFVFPSIALLTISSTIIWTYIVAFTYEGTFICIPIVILSNYYALKTTKKLYDIKRSVIRDKHNSLTQASYVLKKVSNLETSIISACIPCVVGDDPRIMISQMISSFLSRLVIIGIIIILYYMNTESHWMSRIPLLSCVNKPKVNVSVCRSWEECFACVDFIPSNETCDTLTSKISKYLTIMEWTQWLHKYFGLCGSETIIQRSLLFKAIFGDKRIRRSVLQMKPEFATQYFFNRAGPSGHLPIVEVVKAGDAELLEAFLKNGASTTVFDDDGNSPLHLAVRRQKPELVSLLLEYKANPDIQTEGSKYTPLHEAALNGDIKIAELLLSMGGAPNLVDSAGDTAINIGAEQSNVNVVMKLLEYKADPNIQNKNGKTPLHSAVSQGSQEITLLLLKNNANPNVQEAINGHTPLHIALKNENFDLVKILVDYKADVCIQHRYGCNPMHIAISLGNSSISDLLLDQSTHIDIKDELGFTELHTAVSTDNLEMVERLLQKGANVNTQNKYKLNTALHTAIERENLQIVKLLLTHHSNTNIRNAKRNTPLHLASALANTEFTTLLLKHKADVNVANATEETPLHIALKNKNLKVVEILLEHGADIRARNAEGDTVLHIACRYSDVNSLNLLLQYGMLKNNN